MKKYFVFIFVLAAFVGTSFVQAHAGTGANLFKVEVGPVIPMSGDLEDVANTGFMLGGQWIHSISPTLGLGVEASYIAYDEKSQGNMETEVEMMTLTGLGRFNLGSSSSKEPYLLAGLGITETDLDFNSNSGLLLTSDDDMSPSLLFGGGLDIPFEKLALGLEARYQHFFFDIGNVEGGGALQLLAQLRW